MSGPADLQKIFWERPELAKRRSPLHPAVSAYVAQILDRLRGSVPLGRETRLLDVGCGDGRFTYYFGKECAATGIDFSEALVARSLCPDIRRMDATSLEFPDGSFDVSFEHALLHHVEDPSRVVGEMARVSRRWVVLVEPNRANPLQFAYHALLRAERKGLRGTMRRLRSLARGAGLRETAAWTCGSLSANWTPGALAPFFARFDAAHPLGMVHLLVAEK